MTVAQMQAAFGPEATSNPAVILDAIHDVAWDVFNGYTGTDPWAVRTLIDLSGAFASFSQLLARKVEPAGV